MKSHKIFKIRRNYVFLLLLLSIFSILVCAFIPGWVSANSSTSELPFSLHSVKEADYTIDHSKPTFPAIGLGIIEDVMRDNNVSEEEIAIRVGTLSSNLLTPVPRSTGIISIPNTPVPATPINALPTFSTTKSPAPTAMLATSNPTQIIPTALPPTAIPPTPQIIYPPAPTEKPDDEPKPAIALNSSVSGYADKDSSGSITFNDDIQYQFTVTNTGDTVLSNISVSDNSFGGTISCPTATLSAGASIVCTADTLHNITLPEANAGFVSMNSTVQSAYDGKSYSKSSILRTAISQDPAITLEKKLEYYNDNDSSSSITEGDALWYKSKVRNTGNVTVYNPDVRDDTFNLTVTCPSNTIDPGTYIYCRATTAHTVTSAEVTAGEVTNSATGSVQFDGTLYTASDTLVTSVSPTPPNPSISLVKELASYNDNDASSGISLGDGLVYQFIVSNTGNVTLSDIQVTDLSFAIPVSCPETSLASSENMTCAADSAYTVTIVDGIAGQVTNNAQASGIYLSTAYTNSDSLVTNITQGTGMISGYVREDLDGDGDILDTDPGIAGVTVNLVDNPETTTLGTVTTDANGYFSFNDLPAGKYAIVEIDLPGYTSTADSNGNNLNRIPLTLTVGGTSTDNVFLDHNPSAECTDPDPVNGFIASTIPANGAANVPISTTTITVIYNQAMMATGGQSVDRADKYLFKNQDTNGTISITGVTYDPGTYTVVLSIDTAAPDWQAVNTYELTVKTVQNSCGTSQTSVTRTFTTE